MPRPPRSHSPGDVFHLTARTQGQEPWFTKPIRDRIAAFLADAIRESDARLLAYAIMPNHLHVVLQQGAARLETVMHPLLLRSALLVNGTRGTEGHVFERRYRDQLCHTPRRVRNTVAYVNLNAVRKGLVRDPCDYPWTAHSVYAGIEARKKLAVDELVDCAAGLRLFRSDDLATPSPITYRRCIELRLERDVWLIASDSGDDAGPPPPEPPDPDSPPYWSECYAPLFPNGRRPRLALEPTPVDVEQALDRIILEVLAEAEPSGDRITLEKVRSRCRIPHVLAVRRTVAGLARRAGYRNIEIARYLRISPQTVSDLVGAYRAHTG